MIKIRGIVKQRHCSSSFSTNVVSIISGCAFAPFSLSLSKMAFLLNKANMLSQLRSQSQKTEDALSLSRRGFHIEPGPREKALLAKDPALKQFKSHKKGVWRIKRIGDVLTIVVVAGCCYEIYVRATMREEARKQARVASQTA